MTSPAIKFRSRHRKSDLLEEVLTWPSTVEHRPLGCTVIAPFLGGIQSRGEQSRDTGKCLAQPCDCSNNGFNLKMLARIG